MLHSATTQMEVLKRFFLGDPWNLLQLLAAVFSTLSALLYLCMSSSAVPAAAVASFAMWLEVLHFLRAFEFTGGLVRMVFKVFYYTGPFLLILTVVLIGTTNCFYLLFRWAPLCCSRGSTRTRGGR